MNFLDLIRAEQPAPAQMPAMDGTADPLTAWRAVISGHGPQFLGLSDTQVAARQWLNQPFGTAADMDAKITAGKA